jgi:hypothetical protein
MLAEWNEPIYAKQTDSTNITVFESPQTKIHYSMNCTTKSANYSR